MNYQVSADSLMTTINKYGGYSVTTRKNVTTTNSSAKSAREANEDLRKAIRGLSDYDESKDTDVAVENYIQSFVDAYNDLCTNGEEVNSSQFKKSLSKLKECVNDNSSDLKKIGITLNSKSKLEFDTDKFKDSTTAERKKVFGNSESFIGQVQKLARDTYRKTDKQVSYTESKDLTVSIMLNEDEYKQANKVYTLSQVLKGVYENRADALEKNDWLNNVMKMYADQYNDTMGSGTVQNEYMEKIKSLHQVDDVKSDFEQLGISISEDGSMVLDKTVADTEGHGVTAEATIKAFDDLFASDSSYRNLTYTYCGKAFQSLVGAATAGITVNEYA